MEARKLTPHNPIFEATRDKLEGVLGRVQSELWQERSHSEAEEALTVEGHELMRCLLEEWIVLRALAEPTEPVVGVERIERTRVRRRLRHLTTSLGVVSVSRLEYGCPGLDSPV